MMGRVYHDGPLVNSQKSTSRRIDDTYLRDNFIRVSAYLPPVVPMPIEALKES
jgi:hypothetical protein